MEHGASRVEQDESSKDQETKRQSVREAYGLPERYFLSLGRMVEKKNLSTLVEAYARFARATGERSKAETGNLKPELPETAEGGDDATTSAEPRLCETGLSQNCELKTEHYPPALVFVGSGELEAALREQASGLGLKVVDRTNLRAGKTLETCDSLPATRHEEDRGAVYFYGFRQIEENPVFYALAEAFVLPSLKEEWGLVVNEAMACSLPVIVSRTAGCAEDLVPASGSMERGARSMESGEGAGSLSPQRSTLNSLEERSNGFVFDPKSSDALSEALRRIADQKTNSQVFEPQMAPRQTARGRAEGKPSDQETNGLTEMGRRSREIVAKFSCENFARQALRAAEAAGS